MTLLEQVETLYQLLATDNRLESSGLFRIADGTLTTPLANDTLSLFSHRTKRKSELVEQSAVEGIIAVLKAHPGYKGINHIGFCYKVASKDSEITRITRTASAKGYSVYQEPSSDDAAWLFVGDISDVTNPLLEFLPHEGKTNDKWINYWLPHIQFDIDSGLSPSHIETLVKKYIRRPFTPYSIKIDGITYIQRVNLGCLEGVNLMLDISTDNRDINHRKTWSKLA